MNDYLKPLIKLFEENANSENAFAMKKYMKGHFDFYGIKSPLRKELSRAFLKSNGYPEVDQLDEITKDCWEQPQRELQYTILEILGKLAKKAPSSRVELYDFLLLNKSWWDSVDYISGNLVGIHFQLYPELIKPKTETWMDSGNIWLQRTCLLFQLKYKSKTDLDLLTNFIQKLNGSKEFFINKAIGWILREYSKTDAKWVTDFVNTNSLIPLSSREALKWLNNK